MNQFDHQMLSQNTFGLVDALRVEDLPEAIETEALVPSELVPSAHLMPRLVDFRRLPDDQLDALLECMYGAHKAGQQPPMPLLVKTGIDAAAFARHWNAMQLGKPQPGRKVWLRLHDPRVLHQLLRMATPLLRRRLLGRSEALTYWVSDEWVSERAAAAPPDGGALPYAGAAQWDWARVERIGWINRALSEAEVRQPAMLTRQGALAEHLIERALRHQLVDQDDIVEFVARGLTTSPTFDEHPEVARVIKPGTDDESSLASRLAPLDEQIWNELRPAAKMNLESDK